MRYLIKDSVLQKSRGILKEVQQDSLEGRKKRFVADLIRCPMFISNEKVSIKTATEGVDKYAHYFNEMYSALTLAFPEHKTQAATFCSFWNQFFDNMVDRFLFEEASVFYSALLSNQIKTDSGTTKREFQLNQNKKLEYILTSPIKHTAGSPDLGTITLHYEITNGELILTYCETNNPNLAALLNSSNPDTQLAKQEVVLNTSKDFSKKDFSNADLSDVHFTNANLTKANLTDANLTDANLTDANLTGVDFSGITLSNHTTLKGAIIHNIKSDDGSDDREFTQKILNDKGGLLVTFTVKPNDFLNTFKAILTALNSDDVFLKQLTLAEGNSPNMGAVLLIQQHAETHPNSAVKDALNRTYYKLYKAQAEKKLLDATTRVEVEATATSAVGTRSEDAEDRTDVVTLSSAATSAVTTAQKEKDESAMLKNLQDLSDFLGVADPLAVSSAKELDAEKIQTEIISKLTDEQKGLKNFIFDFTREQDQNPENKKICALFPGLTGSSPSEKQEEFFNYYFNYLKENLSLTEEQKTRLSYFIRENYIQRFISLPSNILYLGWIQSLLLNQNFALNFSNLKSQFKVVGGEIVFSIQHTIYITDKKNGWDTIATPVYSTIGYDYKISDSGKPILSKFFSDDPLLSELVKESLKKDINEPIDETALQPYIQKFLSRIEKEKSGNVPFTRSFYHADGTPLAQLRVTPKALWEAFEKADNRAWDINKYGIGKIEKISDAVKEFRGKSFLTNQLYERSNTAEKLLMVMTAAEERHESRKKAVGNIAYKLLNQAYCDAFKKQIQDYFIDNQGKDDKKEDLLQQLSTLTKQLDAQIDLSGLDLSGTTFLTGKKAVELINSKDGNCDFSGKTIIGTIIREHITKYDQYDHYFKADEKIPDNAKIDFSGADLSRAVFDDFRLYDYVKSFEGAKLNRTQVIQLLRGGKGDLLKDADLTGVDLHGINFAGADLTGAQYDKTQVDLKTKKFSPDLSVPKTTADAIDENTKITAVEIKNKEEKLADENAVILDQGYSAEDNPSNVIILKSEKIRKSNFEKIFEALGASKNFYVVSYREGNTTLQEPRLPEFFKKIVGLKKTDGKSYLIGSDARKSIHHFITLCEWIEKHGGMQTIYNQCCDSTGIKVDNDKLESLVSRVNYAKSSIVFWTPKAVPEECLKLFKEGIRSHFVTLENEAAKKAGAQEKPEARSETTAEEPSTPKP